MAHEDRAVVAKALGDPGSVGIISVPDPGPGEALVHTGHRDDTRIGDEAPHLDEWIARGY